MWNQHPQHRASKPKGAPALGRPVGLITIILLLVLVVGCSQPAASAHTTVAEGGPNEPASTLPTAPAPAATTEALEPVDAAAPANDGAQPALPAEAEPATGAALSDEELIAQGEEIYQKTAGDVGCKACHGPDGKGDVGPYIRGKSAETIQTQLDMNEAMQFIILSEAEVQAVAAYLKWLETQP